MEATPATLVQPSYPPLASAEGPFSESKKPSMLAFEDLDQNISAEDAAEI